MSQKFKLSLPEIDITQNFPLEKIFITSDLHLFHTNIIKYTERPFEYSEDGCHEMNEFLLKKFDMLPRGCLVWNLGDVLLNRHVSAECAEATVKRMTQGRKQI